MDQAHAKLHERVIQQVDAVIAVQQPVRALALAARRFVAIPGAQWEDQWGTQFEHSIKVEINKTARGHRKIILDYLANRIVPAFRNVGADADEETAELVGKLHRADSYEYKAQQARDNAFKEASAGGFGAYRLKTEWDDPLDKDSDDQRINPALLIADADMRVFFDPNSNLYDKADAQWCAVLTALTPAAFERDYPDASHVSFPEGVWKPHYEWFRPEQVILAEYYEKEDVDEMLWVFTHRITKDVQRWWASELEDGEKSALEAQGYKAKGQHRKRARVHKWTMTGAEILSDDGTLCGSEIPVVPVYGNRDYIDGVERFTGHVQMAMDPARVYNAQVSKLVETAALTPREVPIFDPEQITPKIAELWAEQNVMRHPYALAKSLRGEDGSIAHFGPVGTVSPPQVPQVTAALLQLTAGDIAELTNADDGADEVKANTSAVAMDIAATRIDSKSGIYIDAMRQSVQREGEIYMAMAAEVYTRAGRVVEIMDDDANADTATLGEPHTDPVTGAYTIRNDLTRGKYKVIADVTESTSTLRDKTVRRMTEVASAAGQVGDNELAVACITTAIANMDGEGIDDLKDWNRRRMLQLGLAEPTADEKQKMAVMAQAQQQQQPDPQAQALQAQAADFMADAALKQAKAQAEQADALLKVAQAHALGGPDQVPVTPTGLAEAPTPLDAAEKVANIQHVAAQTAALQAGTAIDAHKAVTDRAKVRVQGYQLSQRAAQAQAHAQAQQPAL
jgi:hypothetical protein